MGDDDLDAIYCRAYEAARKPGDDIVQDHAAHIAGLRAVMEAAAKICDAEAARLGQTREAAVAGICAATLRGRG